MFVRLDSSIVLYLKSTPKLNLLSVVISWLSVFAGLYCVRGSGNKLVARKKRKREQKVGHSKGGDKLVSTSGR